MTQKHTPFLEQVARHYAPLGESLTDYCFVFPNRRSGQFFGKHLQDLAPQLTLMPQVTTITDFVTDFTGEVAASPIETLITLYEAYCQLAGNEDYELDKFIYWGNILANDFNDVDLYMVDAQQLLTNTGQLKEISTDYMDDDLKAIVASYLNVHFDSLPDDQFWSHINHQPEKDGNEVQQKYLDLWKQLPELYDTYKRLLDEKGLSYEGRIMRNAAIKAGTIEADELGYRQVVFVGFNVLSTSEMVLFKNLKKLQVAQFCWDVASPALKELSNPGNLFMQANLKAFPQAFELESIDEFPQFQVVGIPSNVGQAKYAFHVVDRWIEHGDIDNPENAIDTAIVLPDENLFTPLLNSVSPRIGQLNVTMGYSLRSSDIMSLMHIVARLHSRSSRHPGGLGHQFLKEDVLTLLSHPLLKTLWPSTVIPLTERMSQSNRFTVGEEELKGLEYSMLFEAIDSQNNMADVRTYIEHLRKFVKQVSDKYASQEDSQNHDNNSKDDSVMLLQKAFTTQYLEALDQIERELGTRKNLSRENSVFYLIDRLASLYAIHFEGEPLNGLQIMGMLETRNLDFKNLIILSMNERVFPRRFFQNSFIPVKLRQAYGMSTIEHQEAMTTYYFYRLVSRAQNVCLVYDSDTKGLSSGEYSRFIAQLDKVYKQQLHFIHLTSRVTPGSSLKIDVAKTGRIAQAVEAYRTNGSKRMLSASSIKEYIKCPLMFYLHHIEGLNADNNDTEFIDAASFGTILHDTLQEFYCPDKNELPHRVYRKDLEQFAKGHNIANALTRVTNREYLHETNLTNPLTGDVALLLDAMVRYVRQVVEFDMKLLKSDDEYIEVIECEKGHPVHLQLGGGPAFNFTFKADRIDRVNGKEPLRIIDYKTGIDEIAFSKFDQITSDNQQKNYLAILQLMLYCNAYAKEAKYDGPIKPIIYKLRDMENSGEGLTYNKAIIEDYRQADPKAKDKTINDAFAENMNKVLNSFFDLRQPFKQREKSDKVCSYCKFVDFCRR